MSDFRFTFVPLIYALSFFSGDTFATRNEQICVIVITEENRNRVVFGDIEAECGGDMHSAPYGNWGVISLTSKRVVDAAQFPGWKHEDGPKWKKQWNSCTSTKYRYGPGQCDYYPKEGDCTTQESICSVMHGRAYYLGFKKRESCEDFNNTTINLNSNFMELYELDAPDDHEMVEKLTFPNASITLAQCTVKNCPEVATPWLSSNKSYRVKAELQIRVGAILCSKDNAMNGKCHSEPVPRERLTVTK